MKVCE